MRSQNTGTILAYWQGGYPTHASWDFMLANWSKLAAKIPPTFESGYRTYPASRLCSEQDLNQVQTFFQKNPLSGVEREDKQALESIQNCINFKQQQANDLAKFLEKPAAANGP